MCFSFLHNNLEMLCPSTLGMLLDKPQNNTWYTILVWSIKHQYSTSQMQKPLHPRIYSGLRLWGQWFSSIKQLPVLVYSIVYHTRSFDCTIFVLLFFLPAKSLHLNKKLFFFFLIWFSHRINDIRGLIVCFQSWLFLLLDLFLKQILFWDVLTRMIQNWKAWCKFYWPPFPTIKDVPTNLSCTGQTKPRAKGSQARWRVQEARTRLSMFCWCVFKQMVN